jgi:hypothetical protein
MLQRVAVVALKTFPGREVFDTRWGDSFRPDTVPEYR